MANKKELPGEAPVVQQKMFILDTNVLLHDPDALFGFEHSLVGIPITVL